MTIHLAFMKVVVSLYEYMSRCEQDVAVISRLMDDNVA